MAGPKADVNVMYDAAEACVFENLKSITDEIKDLEAKKQVLVSNVKALMQNKGITSAELNGATFTLIPATRRTIAKGEKDSFIADLVSNNAKHLVTYSIEPDLDGIFAEVDAGTLDKALVDKYVKVTEYTTLRVG